MVIDGFTSSHLTVEHLTLTAASLTSRKILI
jgi:hypothetical protein